MERDRLFGRTALQAVKDKGLVFRISLAIHIGQRLLLLRLLVCIPAAGGCAQQMQPIGVPTAANLKLARLALTSN